MKRLDKKLILLVLLICLAFASAGYALRPLIFRVEKTMEMEQNVKEFFETAEAAKQKAKKPVSAPVSSVEPILQEAIPYEELLNDMLQYNKLLFTDRQRDLDSKSAYEQSQFRLTDYGLPAEVFGVITIPEMELEMPLYLGASEENMANGAAVLAQTSIPIGGENSNAVIAGHRGWNGYPYFLDIEKLREGDIVTITNLWGEVTYAVTEIQIVSPDDVDAILIHPGKDMITLLTCHPPNTGGRYRYLVYCERATEQGGRLASP